MAQVFRVGSVDLEMSNLNADFGFLLCGAVKEVGVSKPHVLSIDQSPQYQERKWDDSWLCAKLRELLLEFDLIVTWNGARFDIPFLNSRLVKHGLAPLPRRLHKDLLYTSRYSLKLHSNRLEAVQEFLGLKVRKTSISGEFWNRAVTGDTEALKYIVNHCVLDVIVLEEVFSRLKQFIREVRS